MARTIDYYYTLVSPFTYLGGERFEEMARRHGATVHYKPVKSGRLFEATGGLPLPKRSPQRRAYRLQELARWRDFLGMPLVVEPKYFPADDALASRMVIAAGRAGLPCGPLSNAILKAVWAEERNIADRDELARIAAASGLDAAALLVAAERPELAAQWEANTEEAIARGVFGMPTYALGAQLFWGQDRLDFLDRALAS